MIRNRPGALVAAASLLGVTVSALLRWPPDPASGWAFPFGSPERCLALAGLGLALGSLRGRALPAAAGAVVMGAILGVLARQTPAWDLVTDPSFYPRLHLLGPIACLLAGLLLVSIGRWRSRAAPVVGLLIGAALALTASLNDPDPTVPAFLAGAGLSAFWLILVMAGVRRLAGGSWFSTGERIAGGWLLAIGILLACVQFVPGPPKPIEEAASPAAPSAPGPLQPPDLGAAFPPRPDRTATPFGGSGLPKGTN